VQIIWGTQDVVVAYQPRPDGSRRDAGLPIEIFERSGHFPFHDDPARFIESSSASSITTEPAEYDQSVLRELLRNGGGAQTVSGPVDHKRRRVERHGCRRAQRH